MEPLVNTFTINSPVPSADLNEIQQRATDLRPSDNFNFYANLGTALPDGATCRLWLALSGVLNDTTSASIDASIDWRDRVLTTQYSTGATAAELPGSADDYLFDYAVTTRRGYTGRGAYRSGGVLAPSTGNPPAPASTVSWAMTVATNVFLYAHPTSGELYVYNASGGNIFMPQILVFATAPTGWRP